MARGAQADFFGSIDAIPWAARQLQKRGLVMHDAPTKSHGLVEAARRHQLDAMVLDSYDVDPATAGALRDAGIVTLAIIDGETRGQVADIYLDQNFGAQAPPGMSPPGVLLAGAPYALLRRAIVAARPATPRPATSVDQPHVLAFFGGTDALGAAPILTRLLLSTGRPVRATVVAGGPTAAAQLSALEPGPDQSVRQIAPTDELPTLIAGADVVISAAGTSTWELCCLGATTALVSVVDNQDAAYGRVIANGLAAGLGHLSDLGGEGPTAQVAREGAVRTLAELLESPERRAVLATKAWSTVDGLGCSRVADVMLREVRRSRGLNTAEAGSELHYSE